MKKFRNAFVAGLLVLVPLYATIDLFRWLVNSVERSVRDYLPLNFLPFDFRGLGLLISILVILIAGVVTQNIIGRSFLNWMDGWVARIPLVGGIYKAIKKFLETVFDPKEDKFKGVVLVQFPREGVYSIGFRTGNPDPKLAKHLKEPMVNVFVPCTPNPTSGFYLLVKESELVPLSLSVQEAFRIVISMGLVTSEEPAHV